MAKTKNILITGASSGLGEGMARHLAARGHKLALAARRSDRLEALAEELAGSAGGRPTLVSLDVTDFESVAPAVQSVAETLGGLDTVVANAGCAGATPAGRSDLAVIRRQIDTNVTGLIATVEAAVALFRNAGGGHVVGISSVAGVRGMKNNGVYCATKSAVSRYLEAVRLDTMGDNIRVTDLAPGYIETDLNRNLASRPFLVTAEEGTRHMADMIEAEVTFSYVPAWPWSVVAPGLKALPASVLAKM